MLPSFTFLFIFFVPLTAAQTNPFTAAQTTPLTLLTATLASTTIVTAVARYTLTTFPNTFANLSYSCPDPQLVGDTFSNGQYSVFVGAQCPSAESTFTLGSETITAVVTIKATPTSVGAGARQMQVQGGMMVAAAAGPVAAIL